MSRRHSAEKREIIPDARYGDVVLAKLMNILMYDGKKSVAERIVYGALDRISDRAKRDPVPVFHEALDNVKPSVEVRSRRVLAVRPIRFPSRCARSAGRRWLFAG